MNKVITMIILLLIAFLTTVFNFFFAIIAGPNICHYINLFTLALTITTTILLITSKKATLYTRAIIAIAITINILLNIGLINIKYGYTNWHFKSVLELAP